MQAFRTLESILGSLALELVLRITSITFDTVHATPPLVSLLLLFQGQFSLLFQMSLHPCVFQHLEDLTQLWLLFHGNSLGLMVMLIEDLVAFIFLFLKGFQTRVSLLGIEGVGPIRSLCLLQLMIPRPLRGLLVETYLRTKLIVFHLREAPCLAAQA